MPKQKKKSNAGRKKKQKTVLPSPPIIPEKPTKPEKIPQWLLKVMAMNTQYMDQVRRSIAESDRDELSVSFAMEFWKHVRSDVNALSKEATAVQKIIDLTEKERKLDALLKVAEAGSVALGFNPEKIYESLYGDYHDVEQD